MSAPILATKLYIPPPRPGIVSRPRLVERLNECLETGCRLTLISAPAGFGKTTLVSEWIASCERPAAWLSLDEGDNDPARFISYLVAASQTIKPDIGQGLMAVLQSPQPLQIETILTTLLNEISTITEKFILILDDYHSLDSQPVDQSLSFLIEHQPPQMHLVIATREDPSLPLARLRARGQCAELRAAELRFTPTEAAEFLNRMMRLNLSEADVAALDTRTEGWIAGLQLAAISMQGHKDTAEFIQTFTGSHRFVMDYLLEEVLQQQSDRIQSFLLRTSILDRMCGSLCDAVLLDFSGSGQANLEFLEHANLFIVPQDDERHWYRYHHLFGDLVRKRLGQTIAPEEIALLHIRASEWYENNGLILDSFRHAVLANDFERAERLMESKQMPLHQRGAATAILTWLESLPENLLNTRPSLWWKQASLLLVIGQTTGVEEKLQATEAALAATSLSGALPDDTTRNLIGKIAVARATLAQVQGQTDTMLVQARRALEYLHPNNLSYRSSATRILGFAYFFQGKRVKAYESYAEALALAQAAGDITNCLLASIRMGQMQEIGNQLYLAAETFQRVLQQIGDYSPPNSPVAYHGLAWIYYEWNDLDSAEQCAELGLQLAQRFEQVIDRVILCRLCLAYVRLARGDIAGAERYVAQADNAMRQKNHTLRLPDIAMAQGHIQRHLGNLDTALQLAQQYDHTLLQARVLIALNNPTAALAVLAPFRQQAEDKGFEDERLRALVLQALAYHTQGDKDSSRQVLAEVLALAEPGGFIRLFVDSGEPMRLLLLNFCEWMKPQSGDHVHPLRDYVKKILASFAPSVVLPESKINHPNSEWIEPLSQRELEVLQLICQGLSNHDICERLFLALDTVKGHNRRIFDKLQVHRRTEAIARARELGLI